MGNCKETLAAVTELLKPAGHKEWLDSFLPYEQMEEEKVIRPELHPAGDKLSMGEVVRAVSEATDNEAVLVTDVGQNQMIPPVTLNIARNAASSLPAAWAQWASVFLPLSALLSVAPTARFASFG